MQAHNGTPLMLSQCTCIMIITMTNVKIQFQDDLLRNLLLKGKVLTSPLPRGIIGLHS